MNKLFQKIGFLILALIISSCDTSNKTQQPSRTTHNTVIETTVNMMYQNASYEASIHFLDTGNSDCIIIRQNDITIIIDGADSDDGSFITSYLASTGATTITAMINTHPDADHVGGLASIMNEFPIQRLFVSNGYASTKTYLNFIETAGELGLSPEVPLENSRFEIGNGYLTFLNTKAVGKNNDVSLIVLYEHIDHKFLFTGDAGIEQEEAYLDILPDINLLKVGHHGSSSSTSEQLLKTTKPEYAVILVGSGNKYGHPHKEVVDRLTKHDIDMYRTDIDGTIVALSSSEGLIIQKSSDSKQISKQTTKLTTTSKSFTDNRIIITPSGKEIVFNYVFKNCNEVRLYFPNGFSEEDYPEVYQYNNDRDGDKDGYACETTLTK